jgi:AraC-like DNA-binding protein
MKIVRSDQSWYVLFPERGERFCLRRLSLRHGYRICELCAELGCTERWLHKVFTRDIGLPPKEWMRGERMVVARRKLIRGMRPEEVAADLGFSCHNNFRREFLAVYKMPPLQFQRESWGREMLMVES